MVASAWPDWYRSLRVPPGTPPDWAYGPAWGVLYPLTGIAAWLVWRRIDVGVDPKRAALRIWGWQVLLSALWPAAFFGARSPTLALVVMAALLCAIGLTTRAFYRLQPQAGLLLLPYGVWLGTTAYVNAGCFWLGAA
ncbi:MAG: tryptophan-rich sensory protein [Acetobacteraceae bacterium]